MSASITSTFSALLNTVGTVADSVTKVVNNSAASLDMLDMYVRTAKEKQEAKYAVDMETFYEELEKEAALEAAIKSEALERELTGNATLKKHYETNLARLNPVVMSIKNKYRPIN